ncbi:hypothetical protein EVAR_92684_1 [Eumeta japonica]|uniref:Uncharacterized protein n=1 Tax=Eumeta variegata TaxID=151549 RepID=A0A4C1SXR7_EUMVA|nr:hypothetical protein EVAR_92684_1 [Eumeta japonica]
MYEVRACKLRERPASAARKFSEYPRRFPRKVELGLLLHSDVVSDQSFMMNTIKALEIAKYANCISRILPGSKNMLHKLNASIDCRATPSKTELFI